MLTPIFCVKCGKHVRFVWTPDAIPDSVVSLKKHPTIAVEVGSKATAYALMTAALTQGIVNGEVDDARRRQISSSEIADVEEESDIGPDDGRNTFTDPKLREQIRIWNEAAAATNDPDQFAHSDFHAFLDMLGAGNAPRSHC